MKSFKKPIAVLLCIVIIISMSSCASLYGAAQLYNTVKNERQPATDKKENVASLSNAEAERENTSLVPEYQRCDTTWFDEACTRFSEYAEKGDEENALPLYDRLYDELCYIDSMCTSATIDYYEDVTDSENESEMEYMDKLLTDCRDRFATACNKLTRSNAAEAFRAHLNDDDLFDELAEYNEKTEREKELCAQETALESEYYKISDKMMDYSFNYCGKTYHLGDFYDFETTVLENLSENDYYCILSGCMKAYNDDAGKIYLKLVAVRDEIAELNGYDSYADYADKKIYGRDYTASDLIPFEQAVKNCGYDMGDYSSYMYYAMPETDFPTADKLLNGTGKVLYGISDYSDAAFDYLQSAHLYSIGSEENRYGSAFTTSFSYPGQSGFIFMKTEDTAYDVEVLVHEMGHFTENFINGANILNTLSYDLAEVHSTGLEMLSCAKYGKLFDSDGCSAVTADILINARDCVVSGCLYDEWQRYVYSNPDSTLDEINGRFYELCLEYGYGEEEYCSYMWAMINHNFDSPMYYISYAVSAIASLQIWQKTLSNYDDAVKIWENVVAAGVYADYSSTLISCGLRPMSDISMVTEVITATDFAIETLALHVIDKIYG